MKKRTTILNAPACILLFSVLFFISELCQAQTIIQYDVIVTKENKKIEAIIYKMDSVSIKYKKITDPDGPLFSISKSNVLSITQQNGTVEQFVPNVNAENPGLPSATIDSIRLANRPLALLKSDYLLFQRKAARYKNMGFTGAFVGVLFSTVGAIIMSKNDRRYQTFNGSSQINPDYTLGSLLFTAGLVAGTTFTITGFTKSKRYSKRASAVKNELKKRQESTSFHLSPGYNPASQTGFLSVKMNF